MIQMFELTAIKFYSGCTHLVCIYPMVLIKLCRFTHYIYLCCSLTFKFGLSKAGLKSFEMAEKIGQKDLRCGERRTSFSGYLT